MHHYSYVCVLYGIQVMVLIRHKTNNAFIVVIPYVIEIYMIRVYSPVYHLGGNFHRANFCEVRRRNQSMNNGIYCTV